MNKILILILSLIFYNTCYSQSGDYKAIVSQGEIPVDIISTTVDKYDKDIELLKEVEMSRKERKVQKKYSIETNYVLDRFL